MVVRFALAVAARKRRGGRPHETSGRILALPISVGFLDAGICFWAPSTSATIYVPIGHAIRVRRTLAARLILTHPVAAVLAFVAADLGLTFPAALLVLWATFLPAALVTFWTALLARPYSATDAGILAALLGPRGPAADIGILATDFRGTAAFARRGAILTAALAAGH